MVFFTADTHFGHANIIKYCNRPFNTVEEMDETMIRNWNKRVSDKDTVYVLGDIFFRNADARGILLRLKGKKHLIIGNHDDSWMKNIDVDRYFESVSIIKEITDGHRKIVLCHYPMVTWKHERTTYMVHGHIHNGTNEDFWPLIQNREFVLNAGVDINGFYPVTFEEMLENNRKFKEANRV